MRSVVPPKGKPQPSSSGGKKKKQKQKQPTQKTPEQRVKIIGADGKVRWEWQPWPTR